jgi:uncharacterized protein YukE
MAMGSTSTVNISVKMLTDVKDAVSDYRGKANSLKEQLESEVNGLVGSNFVGEAANGFKDFYNKNIVPANGEGLDKLLTAIDDIAQGALDAIPGGSGLDDQLAEGNRQ